MGRPAYAGSLKIEISSKWAVFSKHADLYNGLFANMHLLPPSHSLLNEIAAAVPLERILSDDIQREIKWLVATAESFRQDPEGILVGLAAPQVGIAKRIILVDDGIGSDNKNKGSLKIYLNPEIIWKSEEMECDQEDCYSVHPCIFGVVPRHLKIILRAHDHLGRMIENEFDGYTARIIQHEIDHLNRIRFPDRIGREGQLHWVKEGEFPLYLEQWANWQQLCPWDLWLSLKEGRS